MPTRIDSKRTRWLSMNYNSESGEKRRDTLGRSGARHERHFGSYNAVTWLLDRNVDEGRGGKLAFTDTVSRVDLRRSAEAEPPRSPTCCAGSAFAAKNAWR